MNRKALADQLRECQIRLGQAPKFFIDNLPDEAIIEAYVVCSDCGGRLISMEAVDSCITKAQSHEDFVAFINEHLRNHVHSPN